MGEIATQPLSKASEGKDESALEIPVTVGSVGFDEDFSPVGFEGSARFNGDLDSSIELDLPDDLNRESLSLSCWAKLKRSAGTQILMVASCVVVSNVWK